MKKYLFLICLSFSFVTCKTSKQSFNYNAVKVQNNPLADSVLAYALDHEALYTLTDTLKPISSVKFLRFAVAKDSSQNDGDYSISTNDSLFQLIENYQKVCKELSHGDWEFIMMPFARTEKNIRNIQIYVVRKSVFAKKIQRYQSFFGQWGFTPSTNPAVVLAVIEYETRWDRNRAYGYLFGYPAHAVDFFVEAQKIQDSSPDKKLVPRDFFAIPVFANNKGHFTYATPKDYKPTAIDSSLHKAANLTLENYKKVRNDYVIDTGLQGLALWTKIKK